MDARELMPIYGDECPVKEPVGLAGTCGWMGGWPSPCLNPQLLPPARPARLKLKGCRRWPWLVAFFEANLERSMSFFFGSFRVIRDFDADAAPSRWEEGRPEP